MNMKMNVSAKFILTLMFSSILMVVKTEYLDLTYELNETIPTYPGLITPFSREILLDGMQPEGYWLLLEDITTSIHIGTHVDAPCHFAEGRWCIHEIPFERLIAPAVVIDITSRVTNESVSNMMIDDLKNWQNKYGPIPNGSVVILKCGWGKKWSNKEEYINGSKEVKNTPGISTEAAAWLVDNTNIYGVGVETVSLDERISANFSAHVILLSANIYGIENLANVDKLPPVGATIYVTPVKITGASGGHARIFAKLPELPDDEMNNFKNDSSV